LLDKKSDKDVVEVKVKNFALAVEKVVCGYNKSLSRAARAFVEGLRVYVGGRDDALGAL